MAQACSPVGCLARGSRVPQSWSNTLPHPKRTCILSSLPIGTWDFLWLRVKTASFPDKGLQFRREAGVCDSPFLVEPANLGWGSAPPPPHFLLAWALI